MPLDPPHLLLAALIIFGAFFIRSLTGFGSALISVPLLALFLDLRFAIPFVSLFEMLVGFLLIKSVYHQLSWATLWPMIIGAIIGVVLGSSLLNALADVTLKRILGVAIILFALNLLRAQTSQPKLTSVYWGGLAGGLGGLLGGLFGTSGPPYVMYLSYRLRDKTTMRATLIGLFVVENTWRAGVFAFNSLITPQMLWLALWLLPILALGAFLGHRVHLDISEIRFRQLVAVILVASGMLLLVR
jgi:uncharacterized membrane protein YfcA